MEELWKLREMGFQLEDVADRAEYERLLKRFRDEEQKLNLKNLLFEQNPFQRTEQSEK